jgi:hypothetical protein
MTCISTSTDNDVAVYKGQNATLEVTVKDSTGAKQDLTGATIYFTVRTRRDAATASIALTSTANPLQVFILTPQVDVDKKGKLQIKLLPANTSSLAVGDYVYDVWIVLAGLRHVIIPPTPFVLLQPVTIIAP